MDILNKQIKVIREDGSVRNVIVMLDEHTNKYAFVNLSTFHVCACRFDTPEDALKDLNDNKKVYSYVIDGNVFYTKR